MTTLYRKEQHGKRVRYVPAAEYERWDSWPAGHHLVSVKPGILSRRFEVEPDHAAVLAALKDGEQAILDALTKAAADRTLLHKPTERERKAFEAWKAATSDSYTRCFMPSAMDMVRALEAEMLKRIAQY